MPLPSVYTDGGLTAVGPPTIQQIPHPRAFDLQVDRAAGKDVEQILHRPAVQDPVTGEYGATA